MAENELNRCAWSTNDPLYIKYHDEEWGVPVHDDKTMFEFLILETFQAGLSWLTILRKRENFRKAFAGFDFEKVAKFTEKDFDRLMLDEGIIRNRLKIAAAISNAKAFIEVRKESGTFCNYLWAFVNNKPIQSKLKSLKDIPASTPLSDKISKDLKKRGFKFVGTTIVYAHLQACGLVNDHVKGCFRY
ncbi:DNA-3-methyladenine glycosylase 1 [bioreactor metagenome]|uniref:DNA-3-methyladenine glycosylase 1 n=1 Tax=bioreactor metagenome TaxID=1076179 RepID=A0A644X9X0_9ZZZZ